MKSFTLPRGGGVLKLCRGLLRQFSESPTTIMIIPVFELIGICHGPLVYGDRARVISRAIPGPRRVPRPDLKPYWKKKKADNNIAYKDESFNTE